MTTILPQHMSVLFLGDSGLGNNFGQIAPQIKQFDVYYTSEPAVVGFHAIPEEE